MIDINEFDAIRSGLPRASRSALVLGEVTKPETINYRTLKPERDGLFCERICRSDEGLGVLLRQVQARPLQGHHLRALRRRGHSPEGAPGRMGHIDLAAPVSHIWFFKGVPSRIGYLLDIAPRELEKVLYFAASIVTTVDNAARKS